MRNLLFRTVALLAVLLACAEQEPARELAAPVPVLEWAARVDTLPGTYTRVIRPAEFWDSVLVVPDVGDQIMWRVSLSSGARAQLGSRGNGPGEYARAGWALKVHPDSLAVSQTFAWGAFPIISVASGRGRTLSFRPESLVEDGTTIVQSVAQPQLVAADTLGSIYGAPTMRPMRFDSVTKRPLPESMGLLDTTVIVRFSIADGQTDTLLSLPTGYPAASTAPRTPGARATPLGLGPYGALNLWTVAPDGHVLLVDAASYRLRRYDRLVSQTGEWTLPWVPVRVSPDGWEQYVKESTKGSAVILERAMEGIANSTGVKLSKPTPPAKIVPDMPLALAPVNADGGRRQTFAYDSIAWIPVHRADPPGLEFWDVVNLTRGERIVTLALLENHRLVHATALGAYIVAKDDDDLERVLLYRTLDGAPAP